MWGDGSYDISSFESGSWLFGSDEGYVVLSKSFPSRRTVLFVSLAGAQFLSSRVTSFIAIRVQDRRCGSFRVSEFLSKVVGTFTAVRLTAFISRSINHFGGD